MKNINTVKNGSVFSNKIKFKFGNTNNGYKQGELLDANALIKYIEENVNTDVVICTDETNRPLMDVARTLGWVANDATQMTESDALQVTSIPSYGKDGYSYFRKVIHFDEFKYFCNVTEIKYSTFQYCTLLETIVIPDSVISICNVAFACCEHLTTVTIPHSVKIIDTFAFCDCSSLANVYIGSGITCIDDNAFDGCDQSCFYVECEASTPPLLGDEAFPPYALIRVPAGKADIYATSTNWSMYNIFD